MSYSSNDRERVRPLVEKLQSSGYSVWWDCHLRGGSLFSKEIEAELKEASVVVAVWTTSSLESRWVVDEAELALRANKLIPVRLDAIEPPIGFRQIQTIDFSNWNGYTSDPAMQSLIETITHHSGLGNRFLDTQPTQTDRNNDGASAFEFSSPERPSIAILPFKSLGSDSDQDFIADGIRFGIQATLVQLSGLFLVNAPALNAYRDKDISAAAAGAELSVRYVLEGAVQQAGKKIRATIQLTDVEANRTIWAESYDRILEDVFNLQDEITREVVSALNVKLQLSETGRIWFAKLDSPQAREYYYRGSSYLYEGNKNDNAGARDMFEELYRVQPDSVTGPSNISLTHWLDLFNGWTESSAESKEQATEWAEKAMAYDENNGIGHAIFGYMQLLDNKHEEALDICSTGVKLRSSCPLAHGLLGLVHNYCGNSDAAISSVKEALHLEKVYPTWLINILAAAYRDNGKVERSIPAATESLRLNSEGNEARIILCSDYIRASDQVKARAVADEIIANDPDFNLTDYAKSQPYRDPSTIDGLITCLHEAGLPE